MKGDELEIRTDDVLTTAGAEAVTPEDARQLHDWYDVESDEPITVCVMDSGIHEQTVANHPWFEGVEVVERYDATGSGEGGDVVGHGTACASVYAKTVPNVELVDVRIFGEKGQAGWEVIEDAYEWMIDNADLFDVANLSWGGESNSPAINRHHDRLVSQGVYDIVAAGNTAAKGGSPATAMSAFSAGAVDGDGDLTRFSSYNPERDNPDVSAAGKNVKLARAPGTSMGRVIDEQFVKASGTSFAAPYTGAAYCHAIAAKPDDWDSIFEASADDIPGTQEEGEGVLRLRRALEEGGESPPVEDEPTPGPDDPPRDPSNPTASASEWGFAGNDVVYINADWLDDVSEAELVDDDSDGTTVRFS